MKTRSELEAENKVLKQENEKQAKLIANLKRNRVPLKNRTNITQEMYDSVLKEKEITLSAKLEADHLYETTKKAFDKKLDQISFFVKNTSWIERIFYAKEYLK